MQNVSRPPNWTYESALYAAQDEESEESLMLKIRCTETEALEYILCECLVLENMRIQTLGFARMDPDQMKQTRLSVSVVLGKEELDCGIAAYKFK